MKFFIFILAVLAALSLAEDLAEQRDRTFTVRGVRHTIFDIPDRSRSCAGRRMSSNRMATTAEDEWRFVVTGGSLRTRGGTRVPHRYRHSPRDNVTFGGRCNGRGPHPDELWEYPIFSNRSFRNLDSPGPDRLIVRRSRRNPGDSRFCGLITHTGAPGRNLFRDC